MDPCHFLKCSVVKFVAAFFFSPTELDIFWCQRCLVVHLKWSFTWVMYSNKLHMWEKELESHAYMHNMIFILSTNKHQCTWLTPCGKATERRQTIQSVMCSAEATQRSCVVYIRQAVWVRGQNGLRRLGDEGGRRELLSNSGRQYSLCNTKMRQSW